MGLSEDISDQTTPGTTTVTTPNELTWNKIILMCMFDQTEAFVSFSKINPEKLCVAVTSDIEQ